MCFAPQRRALFRHLNFQKWSEADIFTSQCASRHKGLHFFDISRAKSGPHLVCFVHFHFAPQRRALFSTSHLPKVLREWCALFILTSKCASRLNGVQFFISPLASWLRTRRFSEATFRPSRATNHWKTQCFATFLPFLASASSFFLRFLFYSSFLLIFLFSLPLPCPCFHLSILSEV